MLFAGCSSTATDPAADFVEQFVRVRCDGRQACCTSKGRGFDAEACRADARAIGARLVGTGEDGLAFNPSAASACLQQYEVLPGCLLRADPPRCPDLRVGTLEEGASCSKQPDACAVPAGNAAGCPRGVCVVTRPQPLGAACTDNGPLSGAAFCEPTARCADGRCVPRLDVDQGCVTENDCRAGLTCHSIAHVCAKPRPIGSTCTRNEDCATAMCGGGVCVLGTPSPAVEAFCTGG